MSKFDYTGFTQVEKQIEPDSHGRADGRGCRGGQAVSNHANLSRLIGTRLIAILLTTIAGI